MVKTKCGCPLSCGLTWPTSSLEDTILLLLQDAHWKISTSCSGSWHISCPMITSNTTHIPLASWANLVTLNRRALWYIWQWKIYITCSHEGFKTKENFKTLLRPIIPFLYEMYSRGTWEKWGKYVHTHTHTHSHSKSLWLPKYDKIYWGLPLCQVLC